jgi:hypothetical protein
MRILFVMKHPAALRSLDGVVTLLAERGHRVHLAFGTIKTSDSHTAMRQLADAHPGLTFGELPRQVRSPTTQLAAELRRGIDFLRYLEPAYADAPKLRARAEEGAPATIRWVGQAARRLAGPAGVAAVREALQVVERCLPPPPQVERFLADFAPDVLVFTHLVTGLGRAGFVRAARQLGLHTGYLVFSWDNLTNKGLILDVPELVLVWNEFQAREAIEMHGVAPEAVRITGAPSYDHWFSWSPSRGREDFCRLVGLHADRPIILYACSSAFIAPDEVGFVRRWVGELRARGGLTADAGILVRPHPRNASQWAGARLELPQVAVWPPLGEEPVGEDARRNYFDSLFHAAAVVGINTSAQIEAAIVGRPVHTVLVDEFQATQDGTLHFHYLRSAELGHLHVAQTMEEHVSMLAASLHGETGTRRNERFLRRFVRPLGMDVAVAPLVVEAIEELAAHPVPAPRRGLALAAVVRAGLRMVAVGTARQAARRPTRQKASKLPREPRLLVRKLAKDQSGVPVVAGPWLGDEIGELLYWVPFLRWAQALRIGLRERLVVLSRAETAYWYAGIGSRHLPLEELATAEELAELTAQSLETSSDAWLSEWIAASGALGDGAFQLLPARVIAEARAGLARQEVGARLQARRLEFARLTAPELPHGLELPDAFVAARFRFDLALPDGEAATRLALAVIAQIARGGPLVVLDPPEALHEALEPVAEAGRLHLLPNAEYALQSAVIDRSGRFVGSYGATAYLAAFHGVSAIALSATQEDVEPYDLRLAHSVFGRFPFGHLSTARADDGPDETAERVRILLGQERRSLPAIESAGRSR